MEPLSPRSQALLLDSQRVEADPPSLLTIVEVLPEPVEVVPTPVDVQLLPLRLSDTIRRLGVEALAKSSQRHPLDLLFLADFETVHVEIGKAPFLETIQGGAMGAAATYQRFLECMHAHFQVLEELLQEHQDDPHLSKLTLGPFFRTLRAAADINFLSNLGCNPLPMKARGTAFPCYTHCRRIAAEAPYLLAAHAGLHYLAILSGANRIVETLTNIYGDDSPQQYYRFGTPEATMEVLSEQLRAMGDGLNNAEYARFREEIAKAWVHAAILLDG